MQLKQTKGPTDTKCHKTVINDSEMVEIIFQSTFCQSQNVTQASGWSVRVAIAQHRLHQFYFRN